VFLGSLCQDFSKNNIGYRHVCLLKQPFMVAFGGYDLNEMTDDEIIEFANEILHRFELISHI